MIKWLVNFFKLFRKSDLVVIPGQVDVIPGCDPSQAYLDGKMPSMTIDELIDHLDFRSSIHEQYYTMIVNGEFDPRAGYGDANFHLWAIEGYANAILILKNKEITHAD